MNHPVIWLQLVLGKVCNKEYINHIKVMKVTVFLKLPLKRYLFKLRPIVQ